MQPQMKIHKNGMAERISGGLDRALAKPWLYGLTGLLFLRPQFLVQVEEWIAQWLGLDAFHVLEVMVYAAFTLVLLCYVYRWIAGDIKRKNPVFCCVIGLFGWLTAVTLLYGGASGYHIAWHSGFGLMMLLDMGLQREKESVIRGFCGALELWVYANLVFILAVPGGLPGEDHLAIGWLLGARVYYYRIVFPALALALIRYDTLGKRMLLRTVCMAAACVVTVGFQRGGTGLLGFVLLAGLLLFCARRALPRYITPLTFTGVALALFISIHFFKVHYLFEWLISDVLGKSMTMSNRTTIWENTMELVFNNPITGVGLLPIAYIAPILGGYSHTHNQLLEIMLHGGAVALMLYLGMVYFASKEAIAFRRSASVKTLAIVLSVFAFMGTVEMFHNDPIYYALFVFLSRAEYLAEGEKSLPRISLIKRIKRDVKKAGNKQA